MTRLRAPLMQTSTRAQGHARVFACEGGIAGGKTIPRGYAHHHARAQGYAAKMGSREPAMPASLTAAPGTTYRCREFAEV